MNSTKNGVQKHVYKIEIEGKLKNYYLVKIIA